MSECVVRMKIPTNCAKCDLHYRCSESRGIYGFDAIREMMRLDTVNDKREDEHCLFVCSLPEGHGRLVESNQVAKMIDRWTGYLDEDMIYRIKFALNRDVPTIVPAERSE